MKYALFALALSASACSLEQAPPPSRSPPPPSLSPDECRDDNTEKLPYPALELPSVERHEAPPGGRWWVPLEQELRSLTADVEATTDAGETVLLEAQKFNTIAYVVVPDQLAVGTTVWLEGMQLKVIAPLPTPTVALAPTRERRSGTCNVLVCADDELAEVCGDSEVAVIEVPREQAEQLLLTIGWSAYWGMDIQSNTLFVNKVLLSDLQLFDHGDDATMRLEIPVGVVTTNQLLVDLQDVDDRDRFTTQWLQPPT